MEDQVKDAQVAGPPLFGILTARFKVISRWLRGGDRSRILPVGLFLLAALSSLACGTGGSPEQSFGRTNIGPKGGGFNLYKIEGTLKGGENTSSVTGTISAPQGDAGKPVWKIRVTQFGESGKLSTEVYDVHDTGGKADFTLDPDATSVYFTTTRQTDSCVEKVVVDLD